MTNLLPKIETAKDLVILNLNGEQSGRDVHSKKLVDLFHHHLVDTMNNISSCYRAIPVRKSNGEERHVFAISEPLRSYQYTIKHTILDPLDRMYTSAFAFAYKKGVSVRANAYPHIGNAYMLKMDIRHFFDSIRKTTVFALFKEYTPYNKAVITMLTQLVCYHGHLCQGSCTSPQIANLVLSDFDKIIALFCESQHISYTRYCDDMTFSSSHDFDAKALTQFVSSQLSRYGLSLNTSKTRYFGPGVRHTVTGVTVNTRTRAPREYVRKIRQEVYYIRKFGVQDHLSHLKESREIESPDYLYSLLGRISYARFLDPKDKELKAAYRIISAIASNDL